MATNSKSKTEACEARPWDHEFCPQPVAQLHYIQVSGTQVSIT